MDKSTGKVIPLLIEEEVKNSYLNYAMSVIISRALPDIRDGLKPVHRRILYSMHELGLYPDREYKKCGRIVGDVLGKYHPHGDISIYEALVRLAQSFSLRYPIIKGQGNFGSIDGDPPAAMRYTEAKMARIAEEMLFDIKKETVDFVNNYDETMEEPTILPSSLPFLLINGSSGIAVGMTTNIPPHNITEIANSIIATIENPDITIDELCKKITGPDFPTGGIIFGKKGILDTYKTGKGKIIVRAKVSIEITKTGKESIIVSELPFQVNKANLVAHIAHLIQDKKIDGITDLRDESDKSGMRIVMELRKGVIPKVIINQLFSYTNLQISFSSINLALFNGRPKLFNLKELILAFIDHRKDIIIRRTKFELKKAEEREHILQGLLIALNNIDEVIKIIKESDTVSNAKNSLIARFSLSEIQAKEILEMRLQRLTSLEIVKLKEELNALIQLIAELKSILASEEKVLTIIKNETAELSIKYGDERRTQIIPDEVEEINIEDLIKKEDVVVLISNRGFIKRIALSAYKEQRRGGKGSLSTVLKEDDFIESMFIASTHDYILFVSNIGRAYWLKLYEIPEASKVSRGEHLKNLLSISADEEITTVVSLNSFSDDHFFFMVTLRGIVKKIATTLFERAKTKGIIAINLDPGDILVSSILTNGHQNIILISCKGYALRFNEDAVREMGRNSRGIRGIKITKEDAVASAICFDSDEEIILITSNGYGKRINTNQFSTHGRGTRGQIAYKTSEKTGEIVGALSVKPIDSIVCTTSIGKSIKVKCSSIPVMGKTAMGVRILDLEKPDFVVGIAKTQTD